MRAWGQWVHERATAYLERYYPKIDGKPTVAYLWARTVKCKNCRATVPLLKTKLVVQEGQQTGSAHDGTEIEWSGSRLRGPLDVPVSGKNPSERRAHDKTIGAATMTRSGTTCPFCATIMTWDDFALQASRKRSRSMMIAVVVDGKGGKEYRPPEQTEILLAAESEAKVKALFEKIPFGLPTENTPDPFGPRRHGAALRRYGMLQWADMFTARQLLALGTFAHWTRAVEDAMRECGYPAHLDRGNHLLSWLSIRQASGLLQHDL